MTSRHYHQYNQLPPGADAPLNPSDPRWQPQQHQQQQLLARPSVVPRRTTSPTNVREHARGGAGGMDRQQQQQQSPTPAALLLPSKQRDTSPVQRPPTFNYNQQYKHQQVQAAMKKPNSNTKSGGGGGGVDPVVKAKLRNCFDSKQELGRGTFGVSYLCTVTPGCHQRLNLPPSIRYVVVKVAGVPPAPSTNALRAPPPPPPVIPTLQEVVKEVNAMKSVSSPYIVKYYFSWEETDVNSSWAGKLCICMEYCNAKDLAASLKTVKKQGVSYLTESILHVATQLIHAVGSCHQQHLLHRDIKPANIFLSNNPPSNNSTGAGGGGGDGSATGGANQGLELKLGDFGMAKPLDGSMALTNTLAGTPYYMPPEQVLRNGYGLKADMWSIGVTLYEMVTLRRPFSSTGITSVARPGKPPTEKEIMDGIYKRIVNHDPIPDMYLQLAELQRQAGAGGTTNQRHQEVGGDDLEELLTVISMLLEKDPKKRPSCRHLLTLDIFNKSKQQLNLPPIKSPPPRSKSPVPHHLSAGGGGGGIGGYNYQQAKDGGRTPSPIKFPPQPTFTSEVPEQMKPRRHQSPVAQKLPHQESDESPDKKNNKFLNSPPQDQLARPGLGAGGEGEGSSVFSPAPVISPNYRHNTTTGSQPRASPQAAPQQQQQQQQQKPTSVSPAKARSPLRGPTVVVSPHRRTTPPRNPPPPPPGATPCLLLTPPEDSPPCQPAPTQHHVDVQVSVQTTVVTGGSPPPSPAKPTIAAIANDEGGGGGGGGGGRVTRTRNISPVKAKLREAQQEAAALAQQQQQQRPTAPEPVERKKERKQHPSPSLPPRGGFGILPPKTAATPTAGVGAGAGTGGGLSPTYPSAPASSPEQQHGVETPYVHHGSPPRKKPNTQVSATTPPKSVHGRGYQPTEVQRVMNSLVHRMQHLDPVLDKNTLDLLGPGSFLMVEMFRACIVNGLAPIPPSTTAGSEVDADVHVPLPGGGGGGGVGGGTSQQQESAALHSLLRVMCPTLSDSVAEQVLCHTTSGAYALGGGGGGPRSDGNSGGAGAGGVPENVYAVYSAVSATSSSSGANTGTGGFTSSQSASTGGASVSAAIDSTSFYTAENDSVQG